MKPWPSDERRRRTELGLLGLGVTFAALILLVDNGGSVFSRMMAAANGIGIGPDRLLSSALILNIALVLFGWFYHARLQAELTARRAAESDAKAQAATDSLTGCLNRRSLHAAVETLASDARARGDALAVVMIDIDKFKLINDINGHAVGDRLLCECADRIRAVLPPGALLARMGGDEFACVLGFNPRRDEVIDQFAAAVIRGAAAPMTATGYSGHVTVSLGLARSDRPGEHGDAAQSECDRLLHAADIAMYQAKKQGRNRFAWFEPEMASEARYRSELETAIRRGIAAGEFVPFYEQQIDLISGELVGFEMLARWQSPQLGLVGPDVFIPIAEDIGAIGELSECLVTQALRDARGWHPRLSLSINVSPVQLRDPWFAQKLLKLLVNANFPPNRLEIEITETSLHENIAGVHALVTSLKNQGVRISLDDFGTGYSSLSQLRDLPFDRIKIDRSFVAAMASDRGSASIVETIFSLGESFGLPLTAEGIDSPEVLERLTAIGDFAGQGYLFGKPVPAQQVESLLDQRSLLAKRAPVVPDAAMPAAQESNKPRRRSA
ncbi:MAG: EAL domain-containing protein [Sphingomonadales bacterium]|nr:EAL domain-containing protein [Sphingomonadales bacterium]